MEMLTANLAPERATLQVLVSIIIKQHNKEAYVQRHFPETVIFIILTYYSKHEIWLLWEVKVLIRGNLIDCLCT